MFPLYHAIASSGIAGYLIMNDQTNGRVIFCSGISNNIAFTVTWPSAATAGIWGVTYAGGDLFVGSNRVYAGLQASVVWRLTGVTSTVKSTLVMADSVITGITNDGTNLYYSSTRKDAADTSRIYRCSGLTATTSAWFLSPRFTPGGMGHDGTNVLTTDFASATASPYYYRHVGFTLPRSLEFQKGPASSVSGICSDGDKLITLTNGGTRINVHVGFSSTVDYYFSTPSGVTVSDIDYIGSL